MVQLNYLKKKKTSNNTNIEPVLLNKSEETKKEVNEIKLKKSIKK